MLLCGMHASLVAGVFVGGRSSRMGGRPKGLLELAPGLTLVGRWRAIFERLEIPAVLVGEHAAYAHLGMPAIADEPHAGPLGGVLALLAHAGDRMALAVACDMPFVSEALVRRLAFAPRAPAAASALASASASALALAARREGRWEPFFARYDSPLVLPIARAEAAAGRFSLQGLLAAATAGELGLSEAEAEELDDWDTPEDAALARRPGRRQAPSS
jgi:molybdopterin-guanine dinucleotide biosynthesis protein A